MKFFAEIAKENGQKTIENIRTGERLALLDGRTVLQNDGLTVNYYTATDGTGEGVTEFILTNCVGETKVFVCNAFAGEKVINEYLWEIIANTLDCQKVETLLTAWQNEA